MASVRRLIAILAADVAGYSRLMGADEEGTHERLKTHLRELVEPKIGEHRGRTVKDTGDGLLAEFSSVVDAVRCAVEIQRAMVDRNAETPQDKRITFRVGVNLGDVIVDGDDIYGDGVNIAARLEALAQPGGICVSRMVRDNIRDKLPYTFADMGEQSVKNIARPVRAYTISAAAVAALAPVTASAPLKSPRRRAGPRRDTPRLSIVVLPFTNLSNDPEQEYFADGITDDLTTDLSRISESFVIARNTAFTYKGKPVAARQVGPELGVRYVLEGSVRRTGDQVRVNVQLIDAETSAHVWADRFDTSRANLAEAQDEITGRLARTLNLELVLDVDRRIEREKAADPDARDLVMRGWAWYHRPASLASRQEAERAFGRALELDPESVGARIGIGTILVDDLVLKWSGSRQPDEVRAERLVREALERDTNQSMAHYAMGVLRRVQGRLTEAQIELETAIALDHNNAHALQQLGLTLMYLARPEAGIPLIEKSIRLNPHDSNVARAYWALGSCHLLLAQVDEAIDLLRKGRAANPRLWFIHLWLAGALGLAGDLDEARAAVAEATQLQPEINSLARWHASGPWVANLRQWALREKTLHLGLRRAGFPDE